MRKLTILSSLILCLLLSTLPGRSSSQARGPQSPAEFQRRMEEQRQRIKQQQEEFQRRAEEQRQQQRERQEAMRRLSKEYSEEAYQDALGATAEPWQAIRPKLAEIRRLRDVPCIEISVYAVGGAGEFKSGGFTRTSDGGRSTANASAQYSATRGVHSTSDSSMRSGAGGGYGRSFANGGAQVKVQTPGPVRKQVGDLNLGWQWRRPSLDRDPNTLAGAEKACEQLLDALQVDQPDPEQVHRQIEALRQARQQQQAQLQQARQQLREIVTPEQEAKLILMGYLE